MDKKFVIGVVLGSALLLGGFLFFASKQPAPPKVPEGEIVSKAGLHWHPHLTIIIKDQEQEISKDIGIAAVHNPIHTHDTTGTLHLEFSGLVTKDDLRLKKFFKVWGGKRFDKQCILDNCNGEKGQVKFFVNGQPNDQFENYIMRDKDRIEILYE